MTTAIARPRPGGRAIILPLVLTFGCVVTALSAVVANGRPDLAIMPLAAAGLLWAMWVAPLRKPLLILIFLGLALDKPGDSEGYWQSPVAPLGALLIENLNKTVDVPALKISLLILLLAYLMIIRLARLSRGPQGAEPGTLRPAQPLHLALALSLVTAVVVGAYGLARGGNIQMVKVQLQTFVPLLLMAYLLSVSLRGVRDYRVLAKMIVAAACIKAFMALWVRLTLPWMFIRPDAFATCHGDSLLFVAAMTILAVAFIERPSRQRLYAVALIAPVLVAGMAANNRRLAWVQLALSLIVILAINPRSWATRRLTRIAIYLSPVLVVYCAVGWSSGSKIFAPVQTLRSVIDSDVNRSTWFRDVENYNLVYTFRRHPVLGTGFGHPFEVAAQNDAIASFKEYPYLPHNSVLGLWAFAGGVGFTGLWAVFIVGLLLAVRSYRHAKAPDERAAAAAAIGSILAYFGHCWGDIGFTEPKAIFLAGSGLAIAGQLASSTGAWRLRTPSRTPPVAAVGHGHV